MITMHDIVAEMVLAGESASEAALAIGQHMSREREMRLCRMGVESDGALVAVEPGRMHSSVYSLLSCTRGRGLNDHASRNVAMVFRYSRGA